MEQENKTITLTRNCLVEEALFDLEVKKGDILFFKNDNKKELIEDIFGNHNNIIMTNRLEEKDGLEGVTDMLYFAGDNFDTIPDYWYSKEDVPKTYNELKKKLN